MGQPTGVLRDRDRSIVVHIVNMVSVLVPNPAGGHPGIVRVTDHQNTIHGTETIVIGRGDNFSITISINVGDNRDFAGGAGSFKIKYG